MGRRFIRAQGWARFDEKDTTVSFGRESARDLFVEVSLLEHRLSPGVHVRFPDGTFVARRALARLLVRIEGPT